MLLDWQSSWGNSEDGRAVHSLLNKVSINYCFGNHYKNQVITGHGVFPTYQARFHGRTDICPCGEIGSITHCIYDCSRWDYIREELFPDNFVNLNLLQLWSKCGKGILKILDAILQNDLM